MADLEERVRLLEHKVEWHDALIGNHDLICNNLAAYIFVLEALVLQLGIELPKLRADFETLYKDLAGGESDLSRTITHIIDHINDPTVGFSPFKSSV